MSQAEPWGRGVEERSSEKDATGVPWSMAGEFELIFKLPFTASINIGSLPFMPWTSLKFGLVG